MSNTFTLKKEDMRNYISLKDGFLRSFRCFTLCHCIVFLFVTQLLTSVILYLNLGGNVLKSDFVTGKKIKRGNCKRKTKKYIIIYILYKYRVTLF